MTTTEIAQTELTFFVTLWAVGNVRRVQFGWRCLPTHPEPNPTSHYMGWHDNPNPFTSLQDGMTEGESGGRIHYIGVTRYLTTSRSSNEIQAEQIL